MVESFSSLRALAAASGVGRRVFSTPSLDTVGKVLDVSVFRRASRFALLIGTSFGGAAKSTMEVAGLDEGWSDFLSFGRGYVDGLRRPDPELPIESLVS